MIGTSPGPGDPTPNVLHHPSAAERPARSRPAELTHIMLIEPLQEAIKVRADFQGGTIRPVLFRRGPVLHRVQAVHASWEDREGQQKILYFSVSVVSGDVYQLSFHSGDLLWFADSVMMES
jgi:hypothetical protein